MSPTIYIVGSGPAGIGAAAVLVEAGLPVTMLDAGIELEPSIRADLDRLQLLSPDQIPEQWDPEVLRRFKSRTLAGADGIQMKYAYGSDFPYAQADKFLPVTANNVGHLTPSFARGGFSNVWGAAVLPYTDAEIKSWPISLSDLEPHYRSVFSFLPLSASGDDLQKLYPLYSERPHQLRPSNQAQHLLDGMRQNRELLTRNGITFGGARLAVTDEPSCVYCGQCLFGCPIEIIYSTSDTLKRLSSAGNFSYRSGIVVERVREENGAVHIEAIETASGLPIRFEGKSVFLASGVLPTAKIILSSFPEISHRATLKVSEYFMLPALQHRVFGALDTERLHTLSQIFIECMGASDYPVHLQLYTFNELYRSALDKMFERYGRAGKFVASIVRNRALALQGYLHSDLSSRIEVSLSGDALRLEGRVNTDAHAAIRRLSRKLLSLRNALGFTAVIPQLTIGPPGEGRHAGGSFPMSSSPKAGQTDLTGRLCPTKNIFLSDASVFPSVPASTITLSVMANAQRAAHAYLREV